MKKINLDEYTNRVLVDRLITERGRANVRNTKLYYIASVSFGKDSLYMLLYLIWHNEPLDEVVFYDTGMEFQAIYDTRDAILPLLTKRGIKYTELKPLKPFLWTMFEKPVKVGTPSFHYGYSWCGGVCRWGTTEKLKALDKYAENKNAFVYVGIAADELTRIAKQRKAYKLLPLVDIGFTEKQCLRFCRKRGNFNWLEGKVPLYSLLDRVSCWCCANKNLKELKNMYLYLPEYWKKLRQIQGKLAIPMKGYYDKEKTRPKGVFELEKRFKEDLM